VRCRKAALSCCDLGQRNKASCHTGAWPRYPALKERVAIDRMDTDRPATRLRGGKQRDSRHYRPCVTSLTSASSASSSASIHACGIFLTIKTSRDRRSFEGQRSSQAGG